MKKLIRNAMATVAGIGLYKFISDVVKIKKANDERFAPNVKYLHSDSTLNGKRIAFLGSSITYGYAARGDSFVDYLAEEYGVKATKEAVSGTTLAKGSSQSYIPRMENNLYDDQLFDLFVCQLSTNDQRKGFPLGEISDSYNIDDFDVSTTLGAIEYIIAYVKKTWRCPVAFYTCLRKAEPEYEFLIDNLKLLQKKWDFQIIDIANNTEISQKNHEHSSYMFDDAHPTRAGYRYAWTPAFYNSLNQIFTNESERDL